MISILLLSLMAITHAQETSTPDRLTIPLTDPSRPVFLKVGILNGSIIVKGTSGKDVIVEASLRSETDDEDRRDRDDDEEKGDRVSKGKRGLHRIPNTSTGLSVEEDNNTVSVSTGLVGTSRNVDVTVQVPAHASMKLNTVNDGKIKVDHVIGDVEASNVNGPVTIDHVSGSAVVDAINGEIIVVFDKVDAAKSMSFSSLNGNIDVALPADAKANLMMKNDQGEIYSDFDITMEKPSSKTEASPRSKRGTYRVVLEKSMRGKINGGGAEMMFKNFNGDIYIRIAK